MKQPTAEISQPGPSGSTDVAETNVVDPPPTKKRKLFANYGSRTSHKDSTTADVLAAYLAGGSELHSDCLSFWHSNKELYGKLIPAVLRAFAVPASSALVERVFSHGGIFLKPNRARMSDKLLSSLVFLKCNSM